MKLFLTSRSSSAMVWTGIKGGLDEGDAFFGESSAVKTDSYLPDTTSSAYVADLSSIYLEHGVDSFLMPMLPEQIDPSSVI